MKNKVNCEMALNLNRNLIETKQQFPIVKTSIDFRLKWKKFKRFLNENRKWRKSRIEEFLRIWTQS